MRSIALLLIGAAIVGCATTAAQQPIRSAKDQQRYDQLLAGKVAGRRSAASRPITRTTWW